MITETPIQLRLRERKTNPMTNLTKNFKVSLTLPLILMLGACVTKNQYQALQVELDELKEEHAQLSGQMSEKEELADRLQRQRETQARLVESLKGEIDKKQVSVSHLEDQLTVRMIDKVLFDSGRAQINSKGAETLGRVASVLSEIEADQWITIKGHTDNVPIGPRIRSQFPTNWELSTARATAVVRSLEELGVTSNQLVSSGYSQYQPVDSNETAEGRQRNRRIEIVLTPKEMRTLDMSSLDEADRPRNVAGSGSSGN